MDLDKKIQKRKEEIAKYIDNIRSDAADRFKHLVDIDMYISLKHMYCVTDNVLFKYMTNMDFKPQGLINKNGYAYVWLPHINNEEDEYKCRNIVFTFMNLVHNLNTYKPKGWVIDLRNNTGGIIEYYIFAICQFVDEFELLGVNKNKEQNSIIQAKNQKFKLIMNEERVVEATLPLHTKIESDDINVLINEYSASAAEIISVMLRVYRGAKIYGNYSYGILSLMETVYTDFGSFTYPFSEIIYPGKTSDKIEPDSFGIPEYLYPSI